jgi:hypothetical protein
MLMIAAKYVGMSQECAASMLASRSVAVAMEVFPNVRYVNGYLFC